MIEHPPDDPRLSVVVPVKNSAKTVGDLLESLMKIDYDEDRLEIVFVDGNSTDGTREIVQKYPVRLVDEEGRGLNAARNTGIKHSTGQIVAFTDGDCVVPPDWARQIARNFREPTVSFVAGPVEGLDRGNFMSNYLDETYFQVKPGFRWRSEMTDIDLFQFPAGANMAFRRHALEKIDFFDERLAYGFDDLLPVEQLGSKGFRIVLDPDVKVWHQNRTTLPEILSQHFNYGRGGALLMINRANTKLAQWFATYLFSTVFGIILLLALTSTGLIFDHVLPINVAAGLFFFGFIILETFYMRIAIRTKCLRKMIVYPILDIIRGFAFTFGGIVQLFRSLTG